MDRRCGRRDPGAAGRPQPARRQEPQPRRPACCSRATPAMRRRNVMEMRRVFTATCVVALAALAAAPSGVAAEPPSRFDVEPVIPVPDDARLGPDGVWRFTSDASADFTTTPDQDPCGLTTHVVFTGMFVVKTFRGGRQRIFALGSPSGLLTNTANGRTFTDRVGGPSTFWPEPDGDYKLGLFGASSFAISAAESAVAGLAPGAYHFDRGSALF